MTDGFESALRHLPIRGIAIEDELVKPNQVILGFSREADAKGHFLAADRLALSSIPSRRASTFGAGTYSWDRRAAFLDLSPRAMNSRCACRRCTPSRIDCSTKLDKVSPSSRTSSAAVLSSGSTRSDGMVADFIRVKAPCVANATHCRSSRPCPQVCRLQPIGSDGSWPTAALGSAETEGPQIAEGRGDRPGRRVLVDSDLLTEDGQNPSDVVCPVRFRSGRLRPGAINRMPLPSGASLVSSRTGSAVTLRSAVCDQRRRDISRRFITAVNPDLLYHLVRLQSAGR